MASDMTPFANLVNSGKGIGYVYGANREGFLWMRFTANDELYAKMRFELDSLIQPYKRMVQDSITTVETLTTEDDLSVRERNVGKMYAVLLQNQKTRIPEKLYRVQIRSVDRITKKVKVYCVDEHIEEEVNPSEVIPLESLHPDLANVAPLIYKVHLYGVERLQTRNEKVKSILTGQVIKVSLVKQWPGNTHPPEVSIDIFPPKFTEKCLDPVVPCDEKIKVTGLSKYFGESGWAVLMNDDEMKLWTQKNFNI